PDHRIAELAPRGNAQPPIVDIGADAFLGPKELVAQRLVDEAGDDLAVALERDRDAPMRNAVEGIGCAVERVDQPAVMRGAARLRSGLFEEEAVTRAGFGELGTKDLLGFEVGGGDELARSLDRDLQLLDLAEVADEATRRLERRAGHDVDEGRAPGHALKVS